MDRTEPTLVPEWLRSTGSATGGGNSAHQSTSFPSHSDALSLALSARNRLSRSISDRDTPRSFSDRSSSSHSRRNSSSNGSRKHQYSSFTRSHSDKPREKEKERLVIGGLWDYDSSDSLDNILMCRVERDTLRHSRSVLSRIPSKVLPQKVVEQKDDGGYKCNNANGDKGSIVSGIHKAPFEKDFPSLRIEEKQGVPEIGRVSPPLLSTAVHSSPIGGLGLVGGEGWTSALADVPAVVGSTSIGTSSIQQSNVASPSCVTSTAMASLNMAEALSLAPSQPRTDPVLLDKTHRLEELAIKQSRQLIPMTPSIPKALVYTDKSKPKLQARTSEMTVTSKNVQQSNPPHLASQSFHRGVSSDASKICHAGKFLVLKPVRDSGLSSMPKDVAIPTNSVDTVANSQLSVGQSASGPVRSTNSSYVDTAERKLAALSVNPISLAEKRPSSSQAQSRNDFFNLMRKKPLKNPSAVLPDHGTTVLSPAVEKSGEVTKEGSPPASYCVTENGCEVTSNGDMHEDVQRYSDVGEKNLGLDGAVYPDEEEAAFLRSLGWEENAGDEEGLTEEEINAFYEEYMKLRPSLKACRGMQPKLSMLSESQAASLSRGPTEFSSSGSEPVA